MKVEKTPGIPESDVILAEAITKISEGFSELMKGGLKRNAVVVLLHDSTKVPKSQIKKVLDGIEGLKEEYCHQ